MIISAFHVAMVNAPDISAGRRGRDRMAVGFTTSCAIIAYHHYSCECEPCSRRDVLDATLRDEVCQ